MAEMSNYLENALINATLRNTSYTTPTTVYVALYTSDPTDADRDRKSTRLNSSHIPLSRMPSSA